MTLWGFSRQPREKKRLTRKRKTMISSHPFSLASCLQSLRIGGPPKTAPLPPLMMCFIELSSEKAFPFRQNVPSGTPLAIKDTQSEIEFSEKKMTAQNMI
jgi:hypothetical protein